MNTEKIRAIIFDMDGTLLDSERLSPKAWDAAAREIGECVPWAIFLKMVGHRSADCMQILQREIGRDLPSEQIIASARKHYEQLVDNGVPLMQGAREIFAFARKRQWKIGIATSTRRESTQKTRTGKTLAIRRCGNLRRRSHSREAGPGNLPDNRPKTRRSRRRPPRRRRLPARLSRRICRRLHNGTDSGPHQAGCRRHPQRRRNSSLPLRPPKRIGITITTPYCAP